MSAKSVNGQRRMLTESQWRQRYRALWIGHKLMSYRLHNPFVIVGEVEQVPLAKAA